MTSEMVPKEIDWRSLVEERLKGRPAYLVKFIYLLAARVSEVVMKSSPSSPVPAYGQRLSWELDEHEGEDALVLELFTCKRKKPRLIALPLSHEYEPWTKDVLHVLDHREAYLGVTRQWMWKQVKDALSPHIHDVTTHSLRHFRCSHLVQNYGFDGVDLTIYAGWTFKAGIGGAPMMDTYVHLDWRRYFPKLLKA